MIIWPAIYCNSNNNSKVSSESNYHNQIHDENNMEMIMIIRVIL